ncbi:metal ABC transporter permease [Uliginosibacterium aquaticum]|uniref:Metal ABC transporter permease n=1 Tax=Uliginosibacterium aquaticum TaxID=2731212 RepID=A0ABX2IDR3_9RHOO|nr:metal ABC transporter permease [Uliginosibacterium aquaticum]NSL54740.1 metal ABC transporter permease [Uliginosibacterium aquaticum]
MNSAGLELSILGPAFVAGLLVLATHVPLGQRVLARGIVFIDLAIAQIAGLGVIIAGSLGLADSTLAVQFAALVAAGLGALLLTWSEARWPEIQEALIGVLFVLASCIALLLLAGNPQGGEHLKDMLVGQILWVDTPQLVITGALSFAVLCAWFASGEHLGRVGFYLLFALAVTASVQLVGVYLVFASLIIPALATRHWGQRALAVAWGMGALAYGLGLTLSALFDLPSGPLIVLAMAALAIPAAILAPAIKPGQT